MSCIKVLITAPLRQDVPVFREYQRSLDELEIPDGVTVERFWVVNDCPEVIPEIRGDYEVMNTGDVYQKIANDHVWLPENLAKMHELRNRTIRRALMGGFDYWFSVDTDLVLHPATLKALLDADVDIVSEIFFTNGWCNAWLFDQYGGADKRWTEPGLYRVGMTGALTLAKRRVIETIDYTPIPCIRKALWGEDRHFSIRAACAGFEMWVDTHYPAEHLYTWQHYQDYINRRRSQ